MNLEDSPKFLTIFDYDMLLNEVSYKPEWDISVFLDPYEGPTLYLQADVVDGYDHTKTVPLRIRSSIPPHRDRWEFLTWLQWRMIQVEIHEAREYFHVNGVPWSDPHDVIEPKPREEFEPVSQKFDDGTLIVPVPQKFDAAQNPPAMSAEEIVRQLRDEAENPRFGAVVDPVRQNPGYDTKGYR